MAVGGGFLVAVGYAMVINMMATHIWPFFNYKLRLSSITIDELQPGWGSLMALFITSAGTGVKFLVAVGAKRWFRRSTGRHSQLASYLECKQTETNTYHSDVLGNVTFSFRSWNL